MSRVFALPPGVDFAAELIRGLEVRHPDPLDFARAEVWVNTARTRRRLHEVLDTGPARLLPKIRLVTELGELVPGAVSAAVSPLERRLELRQLVVRLIEADPGIAARSAAFDLADSLALLFTEMADEGVGIDRLAGLDVSDSSGHWQRSLQFLAIAHEIADRPDTSAQQRAVVEALIARWGAAPPGRPVVLAGSTGSRGPVALLMRHLAGSGQGAVVLPGFDFDMGAEAWTALGHGTGAEDHPQYRYVRLLEDLGLAPEAVERWTGTPAADPGRNRLLSLALRPAPVTDSWMRDGPRLGPLGPVAERMTLIEAPDPRSEAQAIALRLRRAVEDGQRAALITPDRVLARRVRAALDRWRIEPDDSAGTPLGETAPGRLAAMVARALGQRIAARDAVPLLAHPLVAAGPGRGRHLDRVRSLETALRMACAVHVPHDMLGRWAGEDEDRRAWAAWVGGVLDSLADPGPETMAEVVERHKTLVQRLVRGPDDGADAPLWEGDAGEALARTFDDLVASAHRGGRLTPGDYADLLAALMSQTQVRSAEKPHPDVMIWGALEARVQAVDLAILGGLNEGTWPQLPSPDPWLSRSMRKEAGLLSPERRVGLSAHDFQSAAGAAELVLSRAVRDEDAMTVPARWLNRLTNLMGGLPEQGGADALKAMRRRGDGWLGLARGIETDYTDALPEPRPSVIPPVDARPQRLSVTRIATLVRDPHAVYAREVLRLTPLPPLGQAADARVRGTMLHRIFERFLRAAVRDPGRLTEADLLAAAEDVLSDLADTPALRAQWLAAFSGIVPGFVAAERARWREAVPAWFEVRAEMDLVLPDGSPFRLVGVADRIDLGTRAALYDYKSGHVPTEKEQGAFDKQLPLLALMAGEGAYLAEDGAPLPAVAISRAGYLGIGGRISESFTEIDPDILAGFRDGLLALLVAYRDPNRGYTARAMPKFTAEHGDYDHLSRYGEWDASATPVAVRVGA